MLRIKGTKDVPEFKIANFELTCSGGTPGTWKETAHINSGSGPNSFTNKTPYSGTIYCTDNSGDEWYNKFTPNQYVSIGRNVRSSYIIMNGGGEEVIGLYS